MGHERLDSDFLGEAERAELRRLQESEPSAGRAIDELAQILASETFRLVRDHARRLLGFVVAMKLLGKHEAIKESTIAIHAFAERVDYDPKLSSKVRAAAGNVRRKLADYYATEGRLHPLQIRIPVGSYVPEIRDRRLSVGIYPFENLNPKGDQAYLCSVVAEELADQLARGGMIQAQRLLSTPPDLTGLDYSLRGFLACGEDVLCVSVWLSDLRPGQMIFHQAFEGQRDDLLKLVRQAALSIMKKMRPASRRKQAANRRMGWRLADASSRPQRRHSAPSRRPARR